MICDIFIRTYDKDVKWLDFCIKSIHKYAKGFQDIIIVYPHDSIHCCNYSKNSFAIKEICSDGYIDQQLTKLKADEFCKENTSHILFVDSDCCFYDYFSPETYLLNNDPVICVTPYSNINPIALIWKEVTSNILNKEIEYEFMRRQPLMYRRSAIHDFKKWFSEYKNISIEEYMRNVKERYVSEFNLLGAYLYYFRKEKDHKFLDTTIEKIPYNPCIQNYSWDGITPEIERQLNNFIK